MQEPRSFQTWRDLIGYLIGDPKQRKKIADYLGVQGWTLTKWGNSIRWPDVEPRKGSLQRLPDAVPSEQKLLMKRLIKQAYPDIVFGDELPPQSLQDAPTREIPSINYARLLRSYAQDRAFRSLDTWQLAMSQMGAQLDPSRSGIIIRLLFLSSSRRSLCQIAALQNMNTVPGYWFAGRESFAGRTLLGTHKVLADAEARRIVARLQREQRIAGCLMMICPERGQVNPVREEIFGDYADLLAATFPDDAFVEQENIHLASFPPEEELRVLLAQMTHPYVVNRAIIPTLESQLLGDETDDR